MKTISKTIFLIAFVILGFTSCKDQGEPGPPGLDATVYYSQWITPSDWLGTSGDWYFDVNAPDLKADIVESGVILAYVSLDGDVYESNAVRPLPAYAVGANWDFLIPEYEVIEFTSDMISKPVTTGNNFRFIAIPGNVETLKSASLKNKSEQELRSMTYKDVCKLYNIPE